MASQRRLLWFAVFLNVEVIYYGITMPDQRLLNSKFPETKLFSAALLREFRRRHKSNLIEDDFGNGQINQ